jgi:hypothetical protein
VLEIQVPAREFWDGSIEQFVSTKQTTLQLEHSLLSISKWEAKHRKPFLTKEQKTQEELLDYIKCMTITQKVNPLVYNALSQENLKDIMEYLENPMTATTIRSQNQRTSRKTVTSEVIYYWMTALNIPFTCEKWNFNRLMTLIQVCNIESQPPKKMSKKQTTQNNAAINAARRAKLGSKG